MQGKPVILCYMLQRLGFSLAFTWLYNTILKRQRTILKKSGAVIPGYRPGAQTVAFGDKRYTQAYFY